MIFKVKRPLLVLHERKTRLTVITRLASKSAAETVNHAHQKLHDLVECVTFELDLMTVARELGG